MVSFCCDLAAGAVGVALGWARASVALCVLAAFVAPAAALSEPLAGWFAAQSNLRTWSADLTQTRSLKVLSQPLVASGKVWVAPPDRFRWELGQPAQTVAVRQNDKLSLIYPRLQRIEQYPLNAQSGPWRDALALLEASFPRSRAEMEARFRLLSTTQSNAIVHVTLEPRSAAARKLIARLGISFRTNDFSLTATELKFGDGSSMLNDFVNPVLNAPIDAKLFDLSQYSNFTVVEPLRQ